MIRTPLRHTLAAAALLAGLGYGACSIAEDAPTPPADAVAAPSVAPATVTPREEARENERLRRLHDKLRISADQEPLWGTVAQIMRTNDEALDALSSRRHDAAASMTAIEDLQSYGEITAAHAAGVRTLLPAFEGLYGSMSAAQKANADHLFHHVEHQSGRKAR